MSRKVLKIIGNSFLILGVILLFVVPRGHWYSSLPLAIMAVAGAYIGLSRRQIPIQEGPEIWNARTRLVRVLLLMLLIVIGFIVFKY